MAQIWHKFERGRSLLFRDLFEESPAVFSLLSSLGIFGETDEQKQERVWSETIAALKPKGEFYQSPFLSKIDPVMAEVLMGNMGWIQNFGFPSGMQANSPSLQAIVAQLAAGKGLTIPTTPPPRPFPF